MIGRTLSHYRILEEISRGGMGVVYRALDLNLDREIALYRRLLPHVDGISLLTYGGSEEQEYAARLGGVRILHDRWGLGPNTYSLLAPFLYRQEMRAATVTISCVAGMNIE